MCIIRFSHNTWTHAEKRHTSSEQEDDDHDYLADLAAPIHYQSVKIKTFKRSVRGCVLSVHSVVCCLYIVVHCTLCDSTCTLIINTKLTFAIIITTDNNNWCVELKWAGSECDNLTCDTLMYFQLLNPAINSYAHHHDDYNVIVGK